MMPFFIITLGTPPTIDDVIRKVISDTIENQDEFLGSVKKVAEHLDKSDSWVYNRIHDIINPLPYYNGVYVSEL